MLQLLRLTLDSVYFASVKVHPLPVEFCPSKQSACPADHLLHFLSDSSSLAYGTRGAIS